MQDKLHQTAYNLIKANASKPGFSIIRSRDRAFVFLEPVLKVWADVNGSFVKTSQGTENFSDIWEALRVNLLPHTQSDAMQNSIPYIAGYFAYELCHSIEILKKPNRQFASLPLYEFYLYRHVVEIKADKQINHEFDLGHVGKVFWEAENSSQTSLTLPLLTQEATLGEIEKEFSSYSNFSKEDYFKTVSKIIDHIRKGDVYQVNLSQQFSMPYTGSPAELFYALSELSPASYSAFFNTEGSYIISSSPENFLKYDGSRLVTSPIKGTKLRESDDRAEADLLSQSAKNLSELTMIVDIERNDLSKVATADSVKVDEHARVESIKQVHHLVSDISCKLKPGIGFIDIIKAMFPSGSITGAPKIAAMDLISEFENTTRGVYTGSIGWISSSGSFEFSIAIRTALIAGEKVYYSAGGGIVFDSNPDEEYYETLAKTKGFYLAYKSIEHLAR